MNPALATSGLSLRPDPQDRHGRPLPPATAELLILLQVLLVYARHLLNMLEHQAQRSFARLARSFGSAQAGFVLTNLASGILRAIALERVLLAQAGGASAGGQPAARQSRKRTPPAAQQAAQQAAPRQPARPRPAQADANRLPGLPTLRQLQAAISRRPVDSVIGDITHHLSVAFSLCEARFGGALRDAIAAYRGTVSGFANESLRQKASAADMPKPTSACDDPAQKPGAIRYTVGFLRAEPGCAFSFTTPPAAALTAGAQPP